MLFSFSIRNKIQNKNKIKFLVKYSLLGKVYLTRFSKRYKKVYPVKIFSLFFSFAKNTSNNHAH